MKTAVGKRIAYQTYEGQKWVRSFGEITDVSGTQVTYSTPDGRSVQINIQSRFIYDVEIDGTSISKQDFIDTYCPEDYN